MEYSTVILSGAKDLLDNAGGILLRLRRIRMTGDVIRYEFVVVDIIQGIFMIFKSIDRARSGY